MESLWMLSLSITKYHIDNVYECIAWKSKVKLRPLFMHYLKSHEQGIHHERRCSSQVSEIFLYMYIYYSLYNSSIIKQEIVSTKASS